MAPRTLIVHATHLLGRGFLVVSTDRSSDAGEPTNALFAVTRALTRALGQKTPDHAVAVLDTAHPLEAAPPALRSQLEALPALLQAHGLSVVASPHAADLVASYTQAALDAGHDVVVVGSEKRLAQLVGDRVWWYDAYKDVRYTPELVKKRFEVAPGEVAAWLALVGDDDVLPGIDGIGKKGATDLVGAFGSVEAAVARADEVEGRTGKMLRASLAAAATEIARARLDRTQPLPVPLAELEYAAPAPAALNALYARLGFLELLGSEPADTPVELSICDTAELAREALARLDRAPVALHALIDDPSPARGALAGLCLARGDGHAIYFPFAGQGRVLESPAVLGAWLADPERPKVGHDVKAAVVALARRDVPVAGVVGDSACASHLSEPSNWAPHDLATVARQRLRRAVAEEDDVRGVGRARKAWSAMPVERAAAFAAGHADAALAAWRSFEPDVRGPLLDEYLALSDTLVRMELHGIACDRADLLAAGDDFTKMAAELEARIHELAGKPFNLGSTKQLGSVLYEDLGLPIVKRTKTGWSTATEALERIEHAHPIVALVIRWRELDRLKDSWVDALAGAIDDDGRVRSTFHPARSFSGRIVSTQPDLDRVPGRTPEMQRIRRAFRAPPGSTILSVDYNQLGLHVLAHLSRDPALTEPLRQRDDLHRLTAAAVLDVAPDAVSADERQKGKVVNFATFAGQGASALALILGIPAQEAKAIIARFDRRYAVVRAFQEEELQRARDQGFVQTLAGRRWPIGGLAALDPELRSYAERLGRRATLEGSVADVSRRGLLRADQALRAAGLRARPLLQVHDEVLFEVPDDELDASAAVAAEAMRTAFDLEVPLRVGTEAGPSWAELAPRADRSSA
jgi:DNA polymerase I